MALLVIYFIVVFLFIVYIWDIAILIILIILKILIFISVILHVIITHILLRSRLRIKNIKIKTQTSFTATTLGFTKANEVNGEILQDSTPTVVFDDIQQGVDLFEFDVDSSHQRIVAQITQSSATDIDLFLVFDAVFS